MMDHADTPRQGDRDGRGDLWHQAFSEDVLWFLKVSLDQSTFMASLFDLDNLHGRRGRYVGQSELLKPQSIRLLEEGLFRGAFDRGDAARITGLPERSARRMLNQVVDGDLLASATPKAPVSLRFPTQALET